ncbi:MAG: 50S ribosomal protein L22 [Deltaproteobacteria bacterium]|nr:50S ribosomal protein L22 [Deltaproteobacteria bacterium]
MEVKAELNYLRMAPRKVRLVVDLIRGARIGKALHTLKFTPRSASQPVQKLLQSAVANAQQKGSIDVDTLFIKKITVDEGPTLKRWLPRAHGRATPIRKRTSHVTVVLEEI